MSESNEPAAGVIKGDGYTAANLDDLGEGYGFRKVRRALGVTAFGVNATVIPPGYRSGVHYHDRQEEVYFVHQGTAEFRFGDGSTHRFGPGSVVRVDPATHRGFENVGSDDLILYVVGGADGYVGRDGRAPEGENPRAGGPPGA
jgi:mannose-6-phosphate isomerase-like protein (cupin superfamily)